MNKNSQYSMGILFFQNFKTGWTNPVAATAVSIFVLSDDAAGCQSPAVAAQLNKSPPFSITTDSDRMTACQNTRYPFIFFAPWNWIWGLIHLTFHFSFDNFFIKQKNR
jgi:hypothetical protein